MMARRFASGFLHPRQAHSRVYGREAGAERRRKPPASARVGAKHRLMDNPGLYIKLGPRLPADNR